MGVMDYRFTCVVTLADYKTPRQMGKRLAASGNEQTATNFFLTDYVAMPTGMQAVVFFNDIIPAGNESLIGFYNSSKTVIRVSQVPTSKAVSVPGGTAFIRFSSFKTFYDIFELITQKNINPIYKGDTKVEYRKENNQQFFRRSLNGKLTLLHQDYDFMNAMKIDEERKIKIAQKENDAISVLDFFEGSVAKTDFEIDLDNKIIQTNINQSDIYSKILANMDTEFDLIKICKNRTPLTLKKRPMIQVYVQGSNFVTCYSAGQFFEQEVARTIENISSIIELNFTYSYFAGFVTLVGSDWGAYTGAYKVTSWTSTSYSDNTCTVSARWTSTVGGNYLTMNRNRNNGYEWGIFKPDGSKVWDWWTGGTPKNGMIIDNIDGNKKMVFTGHSLFSRIMTDNLKFGTLDTYPISDNDILSSNNNYSRCIGILLNNDFVQSNAKQSGETEWGIAPNGQYYVQPSATGRGDAIPVAHDKWDDYSYWMYAPLWNSLIENRGTSTYKMRDGILIEDAIDAILKQIDFQILHRGTATYSNFLYGTSNPVGGSKFHLMITQKSNILAGAYSEAASKAKVTLGTIMNMLRNCFQCYWYIDGLSFKIEHLKFFENGGSYTTTTRDVLVDLRSFKQNRVRLPWDYDKYKIHYDRQSMPERYQFAWMDYTGSVFDGAPIIIKSNAVEPAKKEDVTVSQFSSDVDRMLQSPDLFSKDGFALLGCTKSGADYVLPEVRVYFGGTSYKLQNGYMSFPYLHTYFWRYGLPARNIVMNEENTTAITLSRERKMNVKIPLQGLEFDPKHVVRTDIGDGLIESASIDMDSYTADVVLTFPTE